MSCSTNTAEVEMTEKLLKLINLDLDTALKRRQHEYATYQLVISALSMGAAFGGIAATLLIVIFKIKIGG